MRYQSHRDRLGALAAEQAAVLGFCRTLSAEEWVTPSGCAGWTVKDVVAHMGGGYHGPFQPSWIRRVATASEAEQQAEHDVSARRSWPSSAVVAEFDVWGRRFLRLQRALRRVPRLSWSVRVPLADLGRYPIGSIVSAFVFDHHTHLRHDIAPVIGRKATPPSAETMAVAVEWMLAGLEQMCRPQMAWLDRPLALSLLGPGGGLWTVTPVGDGRLHVGEGRSPHSVSTITGHTDEFPLWGTRRRPWQACEITITGDTHYATCFLDVLNII
jgi:uncharacterized damage-inducible protein DinB